MNSIRLISIISVITAVCISSNVVTLTQAKAQPQQQQSNNIHNQILKRSNQILTACTPFEKYRINGTVTFSTPQGKRIAETCYNAMSDIVDSCKNGSLSITTDQICKNPEVTKFSRIDYEPTNLINNETQEAQHYKTLGLSAQLLNEPDQKVQSFDAYYNVFTCLANLYTKPNQFQTELAKSILDQCDKAIVSYIAHNQLSTNQTIANDAHLYLSQRGIK